jgi:hypothetical protein
MNAMRTGNQFLESLADGRTVYRAGNRIDDVAAHPATQAFAHRIAELYDLRLAARHSPSPAVACIDDPEAFEDSLVGTEGRGLAQNIHGGSWLSLL